MPFTVAIKARSNPQADLIFDWLDDNVADHAYCYNGMDGPSRDLSFSFDHETDLTLFLLRWA